MGKIRKGENNMVINGKKQETRLQIALEGRLDTMTAPELEEYLSENVTEEVTEVVFDFDALSYVSSAGLRVLLSTQKKMNSCSGTMKFQNVNDLIMDIFDAVGFLDIFTIEQ